MRAPRPLALALVLGALLGGCATSTVTLLDDESGGSSGRVAVLDAKTGAERGELSTANVSARVGGRAGIRSMHRAAYSKDLVARLPYPPRVYTLYFIEGTSDLVEDSKPVLAALRAEITPMSEVQVVGHTDTVGDAASNDALSRDRAQQIRAALVKEGLPVANSRVTGRGERELRVPTADNVNEPANRRVDVILR